MIWTLLVALALGPALLNPRAAAQVTVDELPVDCNSSSESFQDRVDRFLRQLESKRPPLSDIRGLEVRLINSSGLGKKEVIAVCNYIVPVYFVNLQAEN